MKALLAVAGLVLAAAASAADTVVIYKYRGADGRMQYSDKPIKGGELIEAFEYSPPAAASPQPDTSKTDADGEARIRKHLANLEAAWREVQASGTALAAAEERRVAGITPLEGETRMLSGGQLGTQRGGGLRPEYHERQTWLEAAVEAARRRNQEAWSRYNQLR